MKTTDSLEPVLSWFKGFIPEPIPIGVREHFLGSLGALIGLFFTAWISHLALGSSNPWFIAPMGASAVLLFAVPSSPLAQPWSIVGGNLIAATIGVTCAKWDGQL